MKLEKKNIKLNNKEIEVCVNKDDNTIWLSQKQMTIVFNKSRPRISEVVKRVMSEADISMGTYVGKADESTSRSTTFYDLEIVAKIGNILGSKIIDELKDKIEKPKNVSQLEGNELIIYNRDNISIDVNVSKNEETVWLNQNQIAELFETTQQNISTHISNIFNEEELDSSVHKDFLYTAKDHKQYSVTFYNLDMILAVGYRVKSNRAIEFRRWASTILKEKILKTTTNNDITTQTFVEIINQVNSINKRLTRLEEIDKRFDIKDKILFEKDVVDALDVIDSLVKKATKEIILIDPYADIRTLNAFKHKDKTVNFIIITSKRSDLSEIEIEEYNRQNRHLVVKKDKRYHDRYLIIDRLYFYHIGSSINYLGRRFSQITLVVDEDIKEILLKRINF